MHTCRLSGTAAMSKQPQIAAVEERNSGLDKGDGGVTQRRCLPRFAIDARRAVDGNGDLAIGGAVHTTIGGAQPQSKAATLIDGHAGVTRQRTFEPGTRKPCDCVDAIKEIVINRNDCRELIVRGGVGKKKDMEAATGTNGGGLFGNVTLRGGPT